MSFISFAWVDPTELTFGSQHIRTDEFVFNFEMTHAEANAPVLNVTIKNPEVGLVGSGRKYWAWMAYTDPVSSTTTPFFFGRLVAPPNDVENEKITISFLARAVNWLRLKQLMSDQLRVDPYDPIFVAVDQRSDPDKVLEFGSLVWHFDRLPSTIPSNSNLDLQVTVSDVLMPEDGFVSFSEADHFYNDFKWEIAQQQLKTVVIKGDVHWTQRASGRVDMQTGTVGVSLFDSGATGQPCWTGGSIVSGWPKGGTAIPGGYMVAAATAFGNAEYGTPTQHVFKWENLNDTHQEGDSMSEDANWTTYPCTGELIRYDVQSQSGLVNPDGSLTMGGDGGVNIPLHVQWSEMLVCSWVVTTSLILDYNVERPRTEKIEFELTADLQPILTDTHPAAASNSEILQISGGDVGLPILKVWSWYTLQATGMTVYPGLVVVSTPEFVGGPLYGVALTQGTVGTTEPAWSDVLGTIITDGGVQWAMIGANVPTEFPTWKNVSSTNVVPGLMILAQAYAAAPVDIWGQPLPSPPSGIASVQIAITPGTTGEYANGISGYADMHPQWPEPLFNQALGGTTVDNTVTWMSLGNGTETNTQLDLPLGLNPANNSFFASDRGNVSIRALINMARAKLRMRNRAIKFTFVTSFEKGLSLTCRQGVLLYDRRLPGGYAYGKITSYTLSGEGSPGGRGGGKFRCTITAEASCGYSTTATAPVPPLPSPGAPLPSPGTPITTPPPLPSPGTPLPPMPSPGTPLPSPGAPPPLPPGGGTIPPTPGPPTDQFWVVESGDIGFAVYGFVVDPGATVVAAGSSSSPLGHALARAAPAPLLTLGDLGDVGYTPPVYNPSDDGVIFPITDPAMITYRKQWIVGQPPNTPTYVPNAFFVITGKDVNGRTGAVFEYAIKLPIPNGYTPVTWSQQETQKYTSNQVTVEYIMWFPVTQFFLELKDLNLPFTNQYGLTVTLLELPMMVNEMAGN